METNEFIDVLNVILSNEEKDSNYIFFHIREFIKENNNNVVPSETEYRLWMFKIWSSLKNFVELMDHLGLQLVVIKKEDE